MRILIAIVLILLPTWAHADTSFTELYGEHLQQHKPAALADSKALLVFWSSDCAPCIREMALLPTVASEHPSLPIFLISLQDEAHTRAHLPPLPASAHVLVALRDGHAVLSAFGDEKMLLPFSVMQRADGTICARHYGILINDIVKGWNETC